MHAQIDFTYSYAKESDASSEFIISYKKIRNKQAKYIEVSDYWFLKLFANNERREKVHSVMNESKEFFECVYA